MNKIYTLLIAATLFSCVNDPRVNVVKTKKACFQGPSAIIYGANNINKLSDVEDRDLQDISKSVAAIVSKKRLFKDSNRSDDELTFFGTRLAHGDLMCDSSLNSQRTGARCSSFLVGPDVIATAAHCLDDSKNEGLSPIEVCNKNRIIFDFDESRFLNDHSNNGRISESDIFKCEKIIDYKLDDDHDYALIKLDRVVEGRQALKMLDPVDLSYGSEISTIGFPQGIVMRASTEGKYYELSTNKNWLNTQLDTFSGNSGGPIIDILTNMVVGIHTHGEEGALELNKSKGCFEYSKRCLDPRDCNTSAGFNIAKIPYLKDLVTQTSGLEREEIGCD